MAARRPKTRYVILKIESYEGDDTFLRCGDEHRDYLYAIVAVDADGSAEIVDSSYRSIAEALEAWPEAAIKARPKRQ